MTKHDGVVTPISGKSKPTYLGIEVVVSRKHFLVKGFVFFGTFPSEKTAEKWYTEFKKHTEERYADGKLYGLTQTTLTGIYKMEDDIRNVYHFEDVSDGGIERAVRMVPYVLLRESFLAYNTLTKDTSLYLPATKS